MVRVLVILAAKPVEAVLAATVTWHLSSTKSQRHGLVDEGLTSAILTTLKWTIETKICPKKDRRKLEKNEMKELDREKLQVRSCIQYI